MFTDNLQSLLVARVRASPPGASLKQSLEGCIKEVEGLLVLTCNQLNFLCEQTVSTCDGVSEDDSSTDTDFETGSLPLLQIMSVESGGPIIDIEYVLPEPFTSIVALARGPPAGPPPPGNKRNLFKKLAAIGTPRTSPSPAMPAPQPVGPQLITFVAESPEAAHELVVSIQAAIERLQGSLEWLDKGLPAWSQLIVVAASVDSGTVQCNDQRSGVLRNIPWGQQLQVKLPSATALDGDLHIIVSSPFGPCNADVSLGELHSMSCSGGGVINCKAIPFVQPVAEDKVGNARKFAVQVTCAVEGLAPLAPVPEQSPVLPLQSPLMEGVGEAASLAGGAVCMEGHDCSHCNHAPHSGFGTPVKAHGSSEKGKQMDWLPRVSPLALPTAAAVAAAALLTPIPQLHATLLALVLLFLAALAVLSPTSSPAALVAEPSPKIAEAPKTEGADEAPTGAPASPRGHSPFEVPISPPSVKPSRPTPSPFHTTAPAPVEGIVVCVRLMRACVMEGLDDIETDVMDLDEVDESGDELTSLERPKLGRTAAKVLDRRITRRMSNLCTASNDVIDLSTARGPRQVLGPAPMSGPVFSHMMSFHPLASSYTDDEATAEERASLRLLTARTPLDVDDQFQRQLDMVRGDRVEALQRVQDTVQWREKNGIDTILDSPNPNFKAIKASFQHGVVGRTRNGVPVFVEGFGKVKHAMGKLKAQGITIPDIMYHFIFLMEWVREELDPGPVPNGRYIRILDLHGLGFMDVVDRDVTYLVRELLGILDYYYPSRLAHTYIVNTPRFFGTLWRMVASSFDPEAEKFMTVCTSKKAALAELRAIMDDDVIPVEYGGKNEEWYLKGAEKSLYDLVDNLNGKDPSTNDLERSRVRRVSAGRALKK